MPLTRRSLLQKALLSAPWIAVPAAYAQRPQLPPPPGTNAKACIVIDAVTGASLFEKNADVRRAPASTQKLLAALVALDCAKPDQIFTVNASDTKVEPHKMYLKAGEKYPFITLLHAMLIESCNDVARCIARNCAGSEAKFAEWMNIKAARLGMKNSRFSNASGLTVPDQYSTARDLAKLARAAIYNPTIRSIVGQDEKTITRPDGRVKQLKTTNHLLRRSSTWYTPFCTGMKTGYTNAAGKCLISSGTYRGRTVICVMLGSSSKIIWKESRDMLRWALGMTD